MTRLVPGCAAPRSPFAPVPSRRPGAVSGWCPDRGRSPFRRDGRYATVRRPERSVADSPSRRRGPRNRCAVGGTSLTSIDRLLDSPTDRVAVELPKCPNAFDQPCALDRALQLGATFLDDVCGRPVNALHVSPVRRLLRQT